MQSQSAMARAVISAQTRSDRIAAMVCAMLCLVMPAQAAEIGSQDFDCLVETRSTVKVGAQVAGVIEKIFVDRGQKVAAGQPLFALQASVEKAEYEIARSKAANEELVAAARAQFDLARSNADRLSQLRVRNPAALNEVQLAQALADAQVAENNLRNAEKNQEVARLEEDRAKAALDQRTVTSPIEGVVLERSMAEGEYRHDQASVLTLVALDPLHVEAFLPKEFFGQVRAGQSGAVTLERPMQTRYDAMVAIVDPVIDAASGTFGVRLLLPNADYAIPAGLRCTLRFGATG